MGKLDQNINSDQSTNNEVLIAEKKMHFRKSFFVN